VASERINQIHRAAIALKDAMVLVHHGTTPDHAKYSAYRTYAEKYNELAEAAIKEVPELSFLSRFLMDKLGNYMNTLWPHQKEVFDSALANLLILIANLEGKLDIRRGDIENLKNFIRANLRKAIFDHPPDERCVQNALESILVGKGLQKGIDYDRESGRVRTSSKEVVPDFIFPKLSLACEIKYIKDRSRVGAIIDEINADITAYSSTYASIVFIVYDAGFVRDEEEFVSGFTKHSNVSCILIKN
jgi:hypothetical protein